MRLAKLVTACGLLAALCAACGIQAKPLAGTADINGAPGTHAKLEDPRYKHVKCLRQHHYKVSEYRYGPHQLYAFQVGRLPTGPTVVFEATPGIAQGVQIEGGAQGAMVIGAALVYPNQAGPTTMLKVESCVSEGVVG